MKAKIHGIEVEGTPEEIFDFKLRMEKHIDQMIKEIRKPKYQMAPSSALHPFPLGPNITSWN